MYKIVIVNKWKNLIVVLNLQSSNDVISMLIRVQFICMYTVMWLMRTCARLNLIKPVRQLFSLLLSINWMGAALVTQLVMHARQRCRSWHRTIHRRRHINYLMVATRWSTSFIKVSGRMCSDEFKRTLGFSFTVIVLA